jgi:uncharacterized protein (TIGR00369 family)
MNDPSDLLSMFPISQTSTLLSQKVLDYDAQRGWVRLSFLGTEAFKNPAGNIQGGILAAMLDDTAGPALWFKSQGKAFPTTVNLNVSFLGAAKPGIFFGEANVTQLGRTIAFAEAELKDADDRVVARASTAVRMTPAPERASLGTNGESS